MGTEKEKDKEKDKEKETVYGYQTANNYSYGSVKEHVRKNRVMMTDAERLLWNELKNDKLGLHFRRQHIIGDYIVDFVCLKCKLIIEVDGDYHGEASQVDYDAYRDWYLQQRGFKVLHFTNDRVEQNLEQVITTIIKNLI